MEPDRRRAWAAVEGKRKGTARIWTFDFGLWSAGLRSRRGAVRLHGVGHEEDSGFDFAARLVADRKHPSRHGVFDRLSVDLDRMLGDDGFLVDIERILVLLLLFLFIVLLGVF